MKKYQCLSLSEVPKCERNIVVPHRGIGPHLTPI
nr:MAG TPA: hypothetical protein [Caudoviricetes sp.]DAY74469.1 MAG TPA: hypothetical protein [Caudoviricetes sp.]